MNARVRAPRGSAPLLLILFLLAACASFAGLKIRTDRIARARVPGASIIYVPSGKFLKYATFGYSSLAADLIYLWTIQYYSDFTIADRFTHLDHIISIINELDPAYLDPYDIGSLIAVYEARDIDVAFRILDRGFEKNPREWFFPFQAGHFAQMMLKDFDLAREYYRKTMAIPGAPDIAKRLYANAAFRTNDYRTAWETWLEVYNTAPDERIKKIAAGHLYRVKAAMDVQALGQAIKAFQGRAGRPPSTLAELVRAGLLPAIPKDFDGNDYLYDSSTGEVKGSSSQWRR